MSTDNDFPVVNVFNVESKNDSVTDFVPVTESVESIESSAPVTESVAPVTESFTKLPPPESIAPVTEEEKESVNVAPVTEEEKEEKESVNVAPIAPEPIAPEPIASIAPVKSKRKPTVAPTSNISIFHSYTDNELDEVWYNEVDLNKRDIILKELQRRDLFPSSLGKWENETGAYPDIKDPEFLQKLLAKREFAESLQNTWKPRTDPCEDNSTFEVTPVQRFNANFMSPKTPYMSALLYHGVGVGKTCAAVQITESWLESYPNAEVFLVAPPTIQLGFFKTIFDKSKVIIGEENEPNSVEQCTGTLYMKLTNTLYERDINKIEKAVNKAIRQRYKVFGYISFANYIRDTIKGIPSTISDENKLQLKKDYIRKKFSGKLLVIDEAHNLRDVVEESDADLPGGKTEKSDASGGKILTPYLRDVLQYSEGMKLCILTATPMYNTYKEIIFMLNLLLMNDKKATITEADVFDIEGTITERGMKHLINISQRYVSFMRGENPISFPVRLFPTVESFTYPELNPRGTSIIDTDKIFYKNLPIVPITLGGDVLKASIAFMNALPPGKGLSTIALEKLVHAGNFIVPATEETKEDTLEAYRERTDINGLSRIFTIERSGGEVRYKAIEEGGAKWLGVGELAKYSPKFEFLINRIKTCEGCVFAYTRFVNAGALPLALALEANGYSPYGRATGLLMNGIQTPGGKQCAVCPQREKEHDNSHTFTPAYYGILTGDISISPHNEQTINGQRAYDNATGSKMKIIIGSQISSEGVDLRFVRETHVIDSWFHLNKTEQILGRAIRFLSHCALPKEKRNNTVYLYVGIIPDNSRETADLYSYRIGFKKAVLVGRVTRVMKYSAIDCNLNKDAIIIRGQDPISVIDSQRMVRNDVNINDMPFTAVCDWVETCEYNCKPTIDVKATDDSTYDEFSARWRMTKLKKRIQLLFKEQAFYQSEDLWNILSDIPRIAAVDLLTEIIDNKNFQVQHGEKSGYIRYCNGYYIFQPNVYKDLSIPLAIRVGKFPIKRDEYTPIEFDIPEIVEEEYKVTDSIESVWKSIEEWCQQLSTNKVYSERPEEISQRIQDFSQNDTEKEYKFEQILEMVKCFHLLFHKSSNKNIDVFRKTLLFYFWDEWLTLDEQKHMVYSIKYTECVEENQYSFGKIVVNRFMNPKNGEIEYICENGTQCVKAIVDGIKKDNPNITVTTQNTGKVYGFLVSKNGDFVFKTAEPPEDGKLKRGKECGNVSGMKEHIKNLIEIGDIIKVSHNFDLNHVIDSKMIKNSTRICTLINLLIRFLDESKIQGRRWFYRPVQALYVGHKGVFRSK